MATFPIGEIVKAQGIKGEVKIKPNPSGMAYYNGLKLVYIDGAEHKLRGISLRSGFAYISFIGIDDRNAAERLVGKKIELDKSKALPLSDGEYYVNDIIGCTVALTGGEVIGKITDISNFGSADVYTVSGGRTARFPLLKRIIVEVDLNVRIITLDKKGFNEVCVYED